MSEHRFQLEKGGLKYACPACQQRRAAGFEKHRKSTGFFYFAIKGGSDAPF
jgi:hypothetical protein